MLTSRERVRMALDHKEPDRVPIQDSIWAATADLWRDQGLPHHVSVEEYFDFEMVNIGADCTPRFPSKVLERDAEFIVETTVYGGVRKNHRDHSTTPEIVDYPVKDKSDWYERIKPRLEPSYTRVDWVTARSRFERERSEGRFICYSGINGYDVCQNYIRTDELLLALITEPEMFKDMVETHATLIIEQAKMMIAQGFEFDGAFLYNDMGYRNGPLFSPAMYRRLIMESDQRLTEFFHSHDMPVLLHSCGNVKPLIPALIEAGIDCLQPLEVKAGMDVIELKEKHGAEMAFMGGIDQRLMSHPDRGLIAEEIAQKFEVAKKGGGYIYHSDHSVPTDVTFEQYREVMGLVRKHAGY
jgi:uroporphyrinogen decarboxylase